MSQNRRVLAAGFLVFMVSGCNGCSCRRYATFEGVKDRVRHPCRQWRMAMFKFADGLSGKPHNNLICILNVFEFLTTGETKELGIAPSSVAKSRDLGYDIETLREETRRLST
jgi:hypothetical protein